MSRGAHEGGVGNRKPWGCGDVVVQSTWIVYIASTSIASQSRRLQRGANADMKVDHSVDGLPDRPHVGSKYWGDDDEVAFLSIPRQKHLSSRVCVSTSPTSRGDLSSMPRGAGIVCMTNIVRQQGSP
jgi:hypothetical protein